MLCKEVWCVFVTSVIFVTHIEFICACGTNENFFFVCAVNFVVVATIPGYSHIYMTEALAARKSKLFFICCFDRLVPRCLAWLAE